MLSLLLALCFGVLQALAIMMILTTLSVFFPVDGFLGKFLLPPWLWRLLLVAFLLLGFLSWPVPQHLANHPATCLGLIPPGLFTRRGSPAGRTPEPDQPGKGPGGPTGRGMNQYSGRRQSEQNAVREG